jgi:PLP dependent protein
VLGTDRTIAENLARVRDAIAVTALRVGRRPEEITLVAVSKTHSAQAIAEALRAGVRHIGENRVQEAAPKLAQVPALVAAAGAAIDRREIVWHMVGHLQSNKAAAALDVFDRIDSVDSVHLAQALSRRAATRNSAAQVLVEIYVGADPARPGIRPELAVETVGQILELPHIALQGVMTVAPLGGDARAAFRQVRELKQILSRSFADVHFGVLSMGMSDDYLVAIEEGSTEIRIGSAVFGPRPLT